MGHSPGCCGNGSWDQRKLGALGWILPGHSASQLGLGFPLNSSPRSPGVAVTPQPQTQAPAAWAGVPLLCASSASANTAAVQRAQELQVIRKKHSNAMPLCNLPLPRGPGPSLHALSPSTSSFPHSQLLQTAQSPQTHLQQPLASDGGFSAAAASPSRSQSPFQPKPATEELGNEDNGITAESQQETSEPHTDIMIFTVY